MADREALYFRVSILEENLVISEKVARYSREVTDYLVVQLPHVSQEKLEMFITHLAMAGKRVEEKTEENPMGQEVLEAVKREGVYPIAVRLRDRILAMTDLVFPVTEREFISVHLCNLLS